MGLDQHWLVKESEDEEFGEFAYHRKFNALEGFMAQEAINQGIVEYPSDFNCEKLPITPEILERLQEAIKTDSLTPTEGFFFGPLEIRKEDLDYLEGVINQAEEYLKEGATVAYTSWW